MEFWVVAAATGAGYVAKHWQNLSGDKDGSSKLSPMLSPRVQPDACQLFRKIPSSVSGSAPIFIEKKVLHDNTDEINGEHDHPDNSSPRSHEFRTNNSYSKSFSSLRPLVVRGNSRDRQKEQMTQVNDVNNHEIMFMEENGASMEADIFEPIGSVKLPRKPEQMPIKSFETSGLHSRGNDTASLFLGITIGILSTTVSNQHEIEHLNELLEQAENMVQDLHNQLEIKDGFTTKENGTEPGGSPMDSPKGKNHEFTSDIEAELEAELERLEENMNSFSQQRLSNVVEIDSDFDADMAKEDLNLNVLTWQLDSRSESDNGDTRVKSESNEKSIFTPNYAVSSLDLRLRLHEVIESELRARIDDLEAVLYNQNSQSKPHSPKSEEDNSYWDFDHTRIESSSSTP